MSHEYAGNAISFTRRPREGGDPVTFAFLSWSQRRWTPARAGMTGNRFFVAINAVRALP